MAQPPAWVERGWGPCAVRRRDGWCTAPVNLGRLHPEDEDGLLLSFKRRERAWLDEHGRLFPAIALPDQFGPRWIPSSAVVAVTPRELTAFANLRTVEAILAFAETFGPLDTCEHGLPGGLGHGCPHARGTVCPPLPPIVTPEFRSRPLSEVERDEAVSLWQFSFAASPLLLRRLLVGKTYDEDGAQGDVLARVESLAAWRRAVRDAHDILWLTYQLRESPVDPIAIPLLPFEEEREGPDASPLSADRWQRVSAAAYDWGHAPPARLLPVCEPDSATPPAFASSDHSLAGTLARLLLDAVTGAVRIFACASCGRVYQPTRTRSNHGVNRCADPECRRERARAKKAKQRPLAPPHQAGPAGRIEHVLAMMRQQH